MKKILLLLIVGITCLLLASCEKAEPPAQEPEPEKKTLKIGDPESRLMEVLGTPQGTATAKDSTIYMYNKIGNVVVTGGKVTHLPGVFEVVTKSKTDLPEKNVSESTTRHINIHKYENLNQTRAQQKPTGVDWAAQQREKEVEENLQARAKAEREAERQAAIIRAKNTERRRHRDRLEVIDALHEDSCPRRHHHNCYY